MERTLMNDLAKRLPEFPNVLARDRYFNSAVLVPFVSIDDTYYLLFQKRAENIRQGAEICFPGGMYDAEKDMSIKQTALRETFEEFGISEDKIRITGQMDTLVASVGATVDSFIAEVDIDYPGDICMNKDEVEKFFIIPIQFFKDNPPEHHRVRLEVQPFYTNSKGETVTLLPSKELGLPERYHQPWGGLQHRVLVYKTDEGIIWGITAEIILDLINRL